MASYKTAAVTLKTAPFAESDKMVTLFSREFGKIRVLAKGARRVPSRFGGRVETFTYADYFIAKGRSLDIVSQCQIIETFQKLRDNEKLTAGLYVLKLVNSGTAEGQHHPELFDLLVETLFRMKNEKTYKRAVLDFEAAFARLEGIYDVRMHPRDSLSLHIERDLRAW
ncbi:MAG: DNA repair protein RecO [Candidatus Margulisbacteria bacterium]|nr:DNA repair protein RecO [Candidatus Margulisiibacteriota bacterium]